MKKNTENTTVATENTNTNSDIVSYEVVAMNGKNKELTFYNVDLIRHTQSIQKYRDAGNLAILAIAHEFDSMDKDESYKSAGFKTVADFGRVVFDYKPATVSLYLRSARAFLTEDENGNVQYRAIPGKAKEVKEEKSDLAKADKLGDYDKDKLPKNTTPETYAQTNLDASIEAFENYAKAMADVEHNDTVDAKIEEVMRKLQELRAELTK